MSANNLKPFVSEALLKTSTPIPFKTLKGVEAIGHHFAMNNEEKKMKEAARVFAKMGGEALKKKLGSKHFSEMGKKGMAKRWGKKK